jgi:NAD(P)-dependent dehydrogenase (short-subunit alcohol dehydrogenase family)
MKVVVITGASAGVGRATALAFAEPGVRLALLARGQQGLDGACAEVRARGAEALGLSVDVGDEQQVYAAAERIEAELGPIDIWINCAMLTVYSPVAQMQGDEYRRVTDVTYLGAVYGTCAALRHMRPRNRGVIVQVGSALSYRAIPLQSAYCAAKFALRGFTDALRVELMADNSAVHLTMVQLSAFNTPQFDWARSRMPMRSQPVPPIFQPELAARAIRWAAEHRRRELCVGFPALKAIYGNMLAPWFADRVLARQGVAGQQSSEPQLADPPDNLFKPVDCDPGSHGRFDAQARSSSLQLWLTIHRSWVAGGLAVMLVAGLVLAS